MPSLTIEANTTVLTPPVEDEAQRRFENEVVGTPGETYTEFTPEPQGGGNSGIRMGFQPPAERRRIEILLAELHKFLNETKSENPLTTDSPPQEP